MAVKVMQSQAFADDDGSYHSFQQEVKASTNAACDQVEDKHAHLLQHHVSPALLHLQQLVVNAYFKSVVEHGQVTAAVSV